MAAQLNIITPIKPHFFSNNNKIILNGSKYTTTVRCSSAATSTKRSYNITLLPGDGIGPEIVSVAKDVLQLAASIEGIEVKYHEMPFGGAAIDLSGVALPEETYSVAKQSDAILLGAIGGYKWDKLEKSQKPETGLLHLRSGLDVFANLRPATVLPQLFLHEALTLVGSKTTSFCDPTTSFALYLEVLKIDSSVGALDCLFGKSLRGIHELILHHFEGESFSNVAKKYARHISTVGIIDLYNFPNLKSLSGVVEHLTNLQSLTITRCENLELKNNEEGVTLTAWKSLHLLSSLRLGYLPKLLNLPNEFQYLTSLDHLEIAYCENLEALPEWLNCLTSLRRLSIKGCCKLKSLPEAIAHMPSLKTLNLRDSNDDLTKRCRKADGEDWSKVRCIPHILLEW